MKLSELLKLACVTPLRQRGDAAISDVQSDSRRCARGCCFVAVRGPEHDGHAYIAAAVKAGASAVVCQDDSAVSADMPCVVVADAQQAVGLLAQAFHGWPARKLVCVGITGTKGKTTIAHMIREALDRGGCKPALLGTISYDTGKRSVSAFNTTPGPVELAEMMAEMVEAGRTHLVMEVSSHAMDQRRTSGIDFRVSVFTNLTGDHLDYHHTMAEYLAAKRKLFEQLAPDATAVINQDDPVGAEIARATKARVVWFGLSPVADVRARIDSIDASGTRFVLTAGGSDVAVATPMIGRHNVMNALATFAACEALGLPRETIVAALHELAGVRGRLERVNVPAPFDVFVDYAHTDDALRNVLSSVQPLKRGRVILVFGCGGDRDRTKRPRMGKVAEELADRLIITSDNPRSEVPEAIIAEILAGLTEAGRRSACVLPNRRQAIVKAIAEASEGDIVLIAGKGHETYQIIGQQKLHFDDMEEAASAMRAREGGR